MDQSVIPNPLSLLNAQSRYGEIHNGVWGQESHWCSLLEIPEEICRNWVNSATGFAVSHIYCNKDFQPHLLAALSNLQNDELLSELKTFDGCFMIRDVRAEPGRVSAHSYAIAIDINAFENQLGHPTSFTPAFIRAFVKAGFIWGGNFKRCDPMHFTLGW
jgi:hypothetical protein